MDFAKLAVIVSFATEDKAGAAGSWHGVVDADHGNDDLLARGALEVEAIDSGGAQFGADAIFAGGQLEAACFEGEGGLHGGFGDGGWESQRGGQKAEGDE